MTTISFNNSGSSGALAETLNSFLSGDRCGANTGLYKVDADITINGDIFWHTGASGEISAVQYDLTSVLLHEFGHVLGHAHACDTDLDNGSNDDRLMYFSIGAGQIKRSIDVYGEFGVINFWDYVEIETGPSSQCGNDIDGIPVIPVNTDPSLDGCDGTSSVKESITDKSSNCFDISLLNDNIYLKMQDMAGEPSRVQIFTMQGQLVSDHVVLSNQQRLSVPSLQLVPSTPYVISVVSSSGAQCGQILIR